MANEREERGRSMLLSFQVITDTHVTAKAEHAYNRNLERALRDIAAEAPATDGIMHAGDVTNHGFMREYREWRRIWSRFSGKLPAPLAAAGNHDVGLGIWRLRMSRFLHGTGMEAGYHDHWIKGYHFIFLGTEKAHKLHCSLSKKQLAWLEAKLGEGDSPEQPTFLFLHQPLLNTVSGSYQDQGWWGVRQDRELRDILARHPQAFIFTGHTHWELAARNCCFDGDGELPHMFNVASVAYLWTDEGKYLEGSQGLYVEVYRDRVVVRGRDFARGAWLEKARFEVIERRLSRGVS